MVELPSLDSRDVRRHAHNTLTAGMQHRTNQLHHTTSRCSVVGGRAKLEQAIPQKEGNKPDTNCQFDEYTHSNKCNETRCDNFGPRTNIGIRSGRAYPSLACHCVPACFRLRLKRLYIKINTKCYSLQEGRCNQKPCNNTNNNVIRIFEYSSFLDRDPIWPLKTHHHGRCGRIAACTDGKISVLLIPKRSTLQSILPTVRNQAPRSTGCVSSAGRVGWSEHTIAPKTTG